jgi:hypothetical protein
MRRKMITIGVVACALALIVGGLSIAQPPAGGNRGAGGGGRFDPAQMRQMMTQRMKEQLGVDDQAWKVMEPRLMKVMELNRQASGMGGRGGMFFGGPRGQRPGSEDRGPGNRPAAPGQQDRELSPLDKATEQLRTTLENQSASPDEIKKQLTAVREAREKAKQELAVAQQELRQILTVRQEAQLVLMAQLP